MTTKDKEKTKSRIISAVGELIAENGFSKVGVNALARQAGVDKVLIYRYFGGLDGLYQAYARSSDFWPTAQELLANDGDSDIAEGEFDQVLGQFFRRYSNALRSRPLTLEILAWETVERNALTVALEEVREALGLELLSKMTELNLPKADWLSITNIFVGAIHYLALRSRKVSHFTGMSLSEDESWDRIAHAMQQLVSNMSCEYRDK